MVAYMPLSSNFAPVERSGDCHDAIAPSVEHRSEIPRNANIASNDEVILRYDQIQAMEFSELIAGGAIKTQADILAMSSSGSRST